MADSGSVSFQLHEILEQVDETAKGVAEKAINDTAKEAVSKLQSNSPKRSGKYAKGWTMKNEGKMDIIVHNKVYRLTHLLENGHVIKNKYGTYGRVAGIKHIAPVEEWANEEVVRKITEELNDNL